MAQPKAYYVAPAGNDAAAGTNVSAPLRTIQRALNLVQSGDTVYVRAGVYREFLTNRTHGVAGSPITVAAYSGEVAVVRGSRVVTNWVAHTGATWKVSGWTNRSQQVFADGNPLQMIGRSEAPWYYPIGLGLADLVPGSFFHDTNTLTLYVWLPDGANPNQRQMEASVGDYRSIARFGEHYIVDGLRFEHSNVIIQWPAVYLGRHTVLRNAAVEWCDYVGVYMDHHSVVENSRIARNGAKGIDSSASNIVIRGSSIVSNNVRGFDANTVGAGVKLFGASHALVASNHFQGNFGQALWVDFCRDATPKQLIANIVEGTQPHPNRAASLIAGIFIEVSRNVLVANNLVRGNQFVGIHLAENDNTRVYNNTIVETEGFSGIEARLNPRYSPLNLHQSNQFEWVSFTSNHVHNNLFFNNRTERDLHWPTNRVTTNFVIAANSSDHNLFYRTNGTVILHAQGVTFTNLAAFTAATGFDANSFSVNPRLNAPEVHDYRLSSLSVAIDAGEPIAEIQGGTDLDGKPRVFSAAMDIGAYEFDGSAAAIMPSVQITTPAGVVSYDIVHVEGLNNANVVGSMWADVSSGVTTTRYAVTRPGATTWILDAFTMATGVTYTVQVTATNLNGTPATASVTVQRGGFGTGRPDVQVTNPPPYDTLASTFTLHGTNNQHAVGYLRWTNYYNRAAVASGATVAGQPAWTIGVIGLRTGLNQVVIQATNAWGVAVTVTAAVHSGETAIHYVSTNAPNPLYPFASWDTAAPTIAEAVEAASHGDTILVAPGTYDRGGVAHELGYSRVVLDKGVTLESTGGPDVTTIGGYREGGPLDVRGVLMLHSNAVLRGFTVADGRALFGYPEDRKHGGGVLAMAMAKIERCVFRDNTALPWGSGAGAMLMYVNGEIADCVFERNEAFAGAGLVIRWGQDTVAQRLIARHNVAADFGGGFIVDNCTRFRNALAWSNTAGVVGGGLIVGNNSEIWNATVEHNRAADAGGIAFLGSTARLFNVSSWFNDPPNIYAVSNHLQHRLVHSILRTNVPANWLRQNTLAGDPLYRNAGQGDLRLATNALGRDRGLRINWLTNAAATDIEGHIRTAGPTVDIGAYELWETIWVYPAMIGYVPGWTTNLFAAQLLWAADRTLFVSNVTVHLPAGWALTGAGDGRDTFAVASNRAAVNTAYTLTPTSILLMIGAPANASGIHTVSVSIAAALIKGGTSSPLNITSSPLPVNNFYYLDVQPSGAGTVNATNGWTAPGRVVTVTAQADPGWRFRGWLGNTANATTNANGGITFTMDRARTITADFVELVTLEIFSDLSGGQPAAGIHVFDRGTRVVFDARQVITNAGRAYMAAGWSGTGSVPTAGTARAFSKVLDMNSALTWRWSETRAEHSSRGWRTRGDIRSTIVADLSVEPDAPVTQVWYHAALPAGAAIAAVRGDGAPALSPDGIVFARRTNGAATVRIEMDVTWPADTAGPQSWQGVMGINHRADEPVQEW